MSIYHKDLYYLVKEVGVARVINALSLICLTQAELYVYDYPDDPDGAREGRWQARAIELAALADKYAEQEDAE
jgi:hypothetical protein